jgi:hypothetical protein
VLVVSQNDPMLDYKILPKFVFIVFINYKLSIL